MRGWGGEALSGPGPRGFLTVHAPFEARKAGRGLPRAPQKVHPDAAHVTSARVSVASASVLYLPDLSGAGEGRPTSVSEENSPVLQEPPNHLAQ